MTADVARAGREGERQRGERERAGDGHPRRMSRGAGEAVQRARDPLTLALSHREREEEPEGEGRRARGRGKKSHREREEEPEGEGRRARGRGEEIWSPRPAQRGEG